MLCVRDVANSAPLQACGFMVVAAAVAAAVAAVEEVAAAAAAAAVTVRVVADELEREAMVK